MTEYDGRSKIPTNNRDYFIEAIGFLHPMLAAEWETVEWSANDGVIVFEPAFRTLAQAKATAEFIAWTREGVPALIAEIEMQRSGRKIEQEMLRNAAARIIALENALIAIRDTEEISTHGIELITDKVLDK